MISTAASSPILPETTMNGTSYPSPRSSSSASGALNLGM
ncbi:MAG: hypothetical protein AVDCRST_MAG01-01-3923 [uncultured Rubrobacteraceae bacterium]|uniref:Uncharacterized protein n=1 Tax=uncultured Rubrobacteraceae bacterium TaxID=349277 RepID=A0A6J4QI22_9ACTN|nr:MAG: hypothetical protein AVDCRST_MAG01-01-3923 [uncultured Rubrobacteraceae bacterium]